uniref:Uncharacterized protein n=1 Tax=Anguilla anguilla TaxID=7936 RepID=A0A0E9SKL5_ANGAN
MTIGLLYCNFRLITHTCTLLYGLEDSILQYVLIFHLILSHQCFILSCKTKRKLGIV